MKFSIAITITLAMMLSASMSSARADAGSEGIKVHGRWEVIVANPDGTVVQHRRFENALTGGRNALRDILLGTEIVKPRADGSAWDIPVFATGTRDDVRECSEQTSDGALTHNVESALNATAEVVGHR